MRKEIEANKGQQSKFGQDQQSQIDLLKQEIEKKNQKLKSLEDQLSLMADQNRSANDQLLQLQRQSAEDKKKNKNLQDDLDTATQEKNKFKRDL